MKQIEQNIRLAIRELGMTVRDLANKSGIPETSLHRILKADDFKLSVLLKIKEALGIDFYELVGVPPTESDLRIPFRLNTGNRVEIDKAIYEEMKLEIERLRDELLGVQKRYIELLERTGQPPPIVTYKKPDQGHDVISEK